MLIGITLAAILTIVILHEVGWRVLTLVLRIAPHVPGTVAKSRAWARSRPLRAYLAQRFPTFAAFVARRVNTRSAIGLPLTLLILAALYLAALFSGLTQEVLEAEGIMTVDNGVNAAFAPARVEPLVSAFQWITALGSSPSVIAAAIIAAGFLWSQRRYHFILPLCVTSFGALATVSIGKFLVARDRPAFTLDVTAEFSSFPSGHSTAAMAVYGFIAYAIARVLPGIRERFEVTYWTMVLVGFIGLSRIYLGVHYLSDVIGGFIVGTFWLLIGFTIAEWGEARTSAKRRGR